MKESEIPANAMQAHGPGRVAVYDPLLRKKIFHRKGKHTHGDELIARAKQAIHYAKGRIARKRHG